MFTRCILETDVSRPGMSNSNFTNVADAEHV